MLVELVKTFRALGRNPALGHRREDLAQERPVLFWSLRDYVIIYRPERRPIEIVTVVRGSRDIPTLLRRI
jgi:plasmid stabilization system protein ParE